MGRPRTVNREPRPPTPLTDPDCSSPLDLGDLEWLMSPPTSASASTAASSSESPFLMPLPTFDQPLWDALGFPSPLSGLTSPDLSFEGSFLDFQSLQASPDVLGRGSNPKPLSEPEPKDGCFCNSTPLIDALRSTLRGRIEVEDGLRSALRATATCSRSRDCKVCANDPSTPIAAFTVLSLAAQILTATVDNVLSSSGGAALGAHTSDGGEEQKEGESSTGMSQDLICDGDHAETLDTASPSPTFVQIGAFTLPSNSARRVLLVALQDSLRSLRDAGAGLKMGDMAAGLEKQAAELDAKITACLNEP